jgi:hypothetical protein
MKITDYRLQVTGKIPWARILHLQVPDSWSLKPDCRGVTTVMVIAFMGIFLLILSTITSYAFEEAKYGRALYDREQAIASAEAGLEYYRWFLAHNPNNLTNGTGQPGPYPYTVSDPETGQQIGNASLSISGNTSCNVIQSIDITSVGKSNLNPGFPRTLFARYMRPSVAGYSYLLNSNVFAGSDRVITGPYFSNGGIRMDGSNNSDVSSAQSTWNCTASYGCSPASSTASGVLGSGSGSALWRWPIASVDFAGIAANYANLKTYAKNNGGIYYASSTGAVTSRGYHFLFKSNGTFDVYRVTATTPVPSSSDGANFATEYNIIAAQTFLGNYAIPPSCSLIFVEDRAWIEGVVKGKVTIVAATPADTSTSPDVIIANNITYATNDGTSGLTAMAEGNVLIPLNSPDTLEIHGIFVAQNGYYGRNFYTNSNVYPSSDRVGAAWASYVLRTQLTTEGSIVSNGRTGTKWTNGVSVVSGYQNRTDSYDELQATNPPPFTPSASTDYSFVLWREE